MLAARLESAGAGLRLVEVPAPSPHETEVRVRVAGCGVCHTDLHILDGTQPRVDLPLTLGHEVTGFVDAAGSGAQDLLRRARLRIGDPVLIFGGWGCGECRDCLAGDEQRCERSLAPGFQRDGGYAEFILVPHPRHLIPLRSLDPVRAAPLADAGLTPFRAVRRAEPWLRPGSRVLLIGCGALGQFALQYLRLLPEAGPELQIAVRELEPDRLERAAALGADVGFLAGDDGLVRETLGGGADVVLDFVGNDESLNHAAATVVTGGLVMLVGEAGGRHAFGFDATPVEAWLTTVAWGSRAELEAVVRLAARRRLRWNVETVPLPELPAALDRLRAGDVDGRLVAVP